MGFLTFFLRPKLPEASDYLRPLSSIKESVVRLAWERVDSEFNLHINTASSNGVVFKIDPAVFNRVDSGKLGDDIYTLTFHSFDAFREALQAKPDHQKFRDWWIQKASVSGQMFQIDFADGPWNIPWELLLGLLLFAETRSETALVRSIGPSDEACASVLTKSLRTLIIKADAPNLNLDREINDILNAWNGLEYSIREAVERPIIVDANTETIIDALRKIKPNILWFSGHGSFDGKVHLHFSQDKSVTSEGFAEMFAKAGHCPEFAVFWACDTATGTAKVHTRPPELFMALRGKGVSAMVGMQSPVHDFAAIAMAGNLFRGLCQGLPLEWSISRARTWLFQNKDSEQLTMDWAAPVVWSARRPVAHLDWEQVKRFRFQMQLLGTISIAEGQEGAGLDEEPPDNDSRVRAQQWSSFYATIVRGNPSSPAHRLWFLRTLKGIQTISSRPVLLVDPGKGPYIKHVYQQWAESFLNVLRLEQGRLPEEFFVRMDILKEDAEIGWRRMCSLPDLFLAIIDPPPASEDWFWEPLFNRSAPFAVLTETEVPERFKECQVNYVAAGREIDRILIEKAKKEHPRLLATLSVINIPVRKDTLKKVDFGTQAENLLCDYADLFISSFGGHVIHAEAREAILTDLSGDALDQAYIDCLNLTDRMAPQQKPYLLDLRIPLLQAIGDLDEAANDLRDLLRIYRTRGHKVAIIRTASNYLALRDGLPYPTWLDIAATYLQLGDQENARLWLEFDPQDALDTIYRLELMASFTKNEGDLDKARGLLEQAIGICENIQKDNSLDGWYRNKAAAFALDCRNDRALLIHWQERKYIAAADEYVAVIDTIETNFPPDIHTNFRHLLSVAHRNLGECILSIEEKNVEERWREAESHFQSALTNERQIRFSSHLIAETQYQLAKLANQRGQINEERDWLKQCIDSAEESHHGLTTAIAKNRLFWLDFNQESRQWDEVAETRDLLADHLRAYKSHSWASRTLIDANIQGAKALMKKCDSNNAKVYLLENLSLLRANFNLRRRSDLERIIVTLAGLQLTIPDKENNQYWSLLGSEFVDAMNYSIKTGLTNPESVWKKEIYNGNIKRGIERKWEWPQWRRWKLWSWWGGWRK
ncbi:MAG: CHAT domain-containing protein [Candidatus Hodarchaeota archaeon]